MKRNSTKEIWTVVVILFILGVIAFYLYDVIELGTPYTKNLFRAIAIILVLLGTLVKLRRGAGRRSLDFYEKFYTKEIGYAFQTKPFQRKKLLCACRLYNESNYRKALKYLFELLKEAEFERDSLAVLIFIALCYTDAGLPEEAIKVYYDMLKIDWKNAQVHSNLGLLLAKEGEYEAAMEHYNKSIELKPDNYYAYINRANLYFREKEYEKAISDAKQALQYKNNGVEAASFLAVVFALQGDEENKKHYYHIAITAGKNPQDLNQSIQYFLNEQNIPSDAEGAVSD